MLLLILLHMNQFHSTLFGISILRMSTKSGLPRMINNFLNLKFILSYSSCELETLVYESDT